MLQSRNSLPSPALAPYVRRFYVFRADLPAGLEIMDTLLSETAFIRLLIRGDWSAKGMDGNWSGFGTTPFVGANSRPMPVRVRGAFLVVGVAIRPAGWAGLFREPASDLADRIVPMEDIWGDSAVRLHADVAAAGEDDAAIVAVLEAALTARLAALGNVPPVRSMLDFEEVVRNDPIMLVGDVAARLGLSVRQFERICHATFGHGPKIVLRRSRFLDMAQAMRGFGAPSVEHLAALHYSDLSHRNREFRHFFGMTAGQFEKAVTPLFTAGLKLRAEGIY